MNYKSPLFTSAIELIGHSTELFAQKNDRKYKFIIVHLANSIELILKDALLIKGHSIYEEKNNKNTVGIWECFKQLKDLGVSIPERPIIELLIDDRNTIQHRFGFPNGEAVYFYLDQVVNFFSRFLRDEYATNLLDEIQPYLKKEHLELLGLIEDENHHLNKLKDVSVEMAILNAFGQIEKEFFDIVKSFEDTNGIRNRTPYMMRMELLIRFLEKQKLLENKQSQKFRKLQTLRNVIAHGRLGEEEVTKQELEDLFELSKTILSSIISAKKQGLFTDENVNSMLNFPKKEEVLQTENK
jgi:uncharacterized protein YutE (UPF0331/DUF86 family)